MTDTHVLPLAARRLLWEQFWNELLGRAEKYLEELNEDEGEELAA